MQGGNKILDDFARMMTDAAGMAQGVKREAEGVFKSQFERMIRDMDLVTREEFEAVRDMAVKAREENDALLIRLEALEAKLAQHAGEYAIWLCYRAIGFVRDRVKIKKSVIGCGHCFEVIVHGARIHECPSRSVSM